MEVDVTQWISDELHVSDFNDDSYIEMRNFVMLWNLFEARLFDCDFSKNKKNIDKIQLESDIIDNTLRYFKDRYTTNNDTNDKFEYLKFENNRAACDKVNCDNCNKCHRKFVRRILLQSSNDCKESIKAIICIICRYRNNLFHGEKDVEAFPNQTDNFKHANKFLIACLETKR